MKKRVLVVLTLVGMLTVLAPNLNADAAWKSDSNGRYYTAHTSKGYLTGWKKIGKYKYYFEKDGYAATGWRYIQQHWYYFDVKGRMLTNIWVDGSFLTSSGKMATNTVIDGIRVDANGNRVVTPPEDTSDTEGTGGTTPEKVERKNCWVEENGSKYYYDYRGKLAKGFLTIKNTTYYMDPETGAMQTGILKINKKYYAFDTTTGIQKKGWVTYRGKTYYFSSKTKAALKGWQKIRKKYYYFNTKGILQRNAWVVNKKYYVDANGQRTYGWLTQGKYRYYLNPKTGVKTIGRKKIGKYYYFFNRVGRMVTDKWMNGKYYRTNGRMARNMWVGGKYVNGSGVVAKTRSTGFNTENGKTYYLNENFETVKNGWYQISSKWYYFDAEGVLQKNTWIEGSYYVNAKGVRIANKMYTVGNDTYLFLADGKIAKGVTVFKNKTYYLDSDTGIRKTGFQLVNGINYYFDPKDRGAMSADKTLIIDGITYVFDKTGASTYDASESAKGRAIAEYAQKFVGYPYVYGGDQDLTKGVDCSGFTMLVFRYFGINIPRVAAAQALGTSAYGGPFAPAKFLSEEELQPGDIICYYSPVSHVGIYIGDGKIVHASNSAPYPQGGIKISNYNYAKITKIVRYW